MMLCTTCAHSHAERTGPHETLSWCGLHIHGYPMRTECRSHSEITTPPFWPFDVEGWEWARGTSKEKGIQP